MLSFHPLISNNRQTTPHASRHELSREVHRVGFHFPTDIVAKVCAHYGIRLTSGGRVINDNNDNSQIVMRVYQKGQLVLDEKVQDQVSINTNAKETIKDLFPNIPDNDLFQIIKTAFQLGDGKVGTADEIPLVRRAQLSVVAHIRHTYTNYDRLLRRLPYNQARHEVEEETLKKLVEWRGDDASNGDDPRQRAVDDLVRDVIVVSDDDDNDSNSDVDGTEQIRHEDLRVEELPSDSYGPTQLRPFSPSRDMYEEAPSGYRIVSQVPRRERLTNADIEAQERNRRAIWEHARLAYRTRVAEPQPQYQRTYLGRSSPTRTLIPLDPPAGSVIRREYLGPAPTQRPIEYEVGRSTEEVALRAPFVPSPSRQSQNRTEHEQMNPPSRPMSPRYAGLTSDGRRYERIPLNHEPAPVPYRRMTPPQNVQYPSSRPITPRAAQYTQRRRSASPDVGHGSVLPSIEGPGIAPSPTQHRRDASDQTRTWPTPPSNFATRYGNIIDLTSSQESASRHNAQVENPFRARENRQIFSQNSISTYANRSPGQYPERRVIDVDQHMSGTVGRIFREPIYAERDGAYREIQTLEPPGIRRTLIPQDENRYQDAPGHSYERSMPFDGRFQGHVQQSLPTMSGDYPGYDTRARPVSPPRRILEPLPLERYPAQSYAQATHFPMMERRTVYTAPAAHGSDRRYAYSLTQALH